MAVFGRFHHGKLKTTVRPGLSGLIGITFDWDPDEHQLKIKKGEETKLRYNFSIVSNENEDYLTYTALDLDQGSEWVLNSLGRLGNRDLKSHKLRIVTATTPVEGAIQHRKQNRNPKRSAVSQNFIRGWWASSVTANKEAPHRQTKHKKKREKSKRERDTGRKRREHTGVDRTVQIHWFSGSDDPKPWLPKVQGPSLIMNPELSAKSVVETFNL
ncbi:hypothetical protein ACFX13_018836 [Malus domestica]